ncbi:LysR family transcriptional regulator [Streptomyces sp. NPDC102340]|uniref:LysR family transcriptional regulator n=1 Tax=unclassified Streptomyces TaxID=2593676 RepID=UPI0037FA3322
MDRLLLMHSFVTVAQNGSFNGAAKKLGSSGSLVSRHVAELERQVGVRLVHRTARSVSLTEQGLRYAEFCTRILDEIAAEDVSIAQLHDRAEGALSIICPKWIGSLDLGDAIAAFSAAHPKIQVRFELGGMSDRTYDFLDSGFDVAFHTRDLRDSGVRLKKVSSLPFVLCASPEYLARHGGLGEPNAIAGHDCLVHLNDPVWRVGHGHASTLHKIRNVAFSSNSYIALQKAAVHGRGIGLLPQRSAYDDLLTGALEVLLPELGVPDRPLFAIYGPGQNTPKKVAVFLDFLTEWFTKNPIPSIPAPV